MIDMLEENNEVIEVVDEVNIFSYNIIRSLYSNTRFNVVAMDYLENILFTVDTDLTFEAASELTDSLNYQLKDELEN